MKSEYSKLLDHIPKHNEYPSSLLQITLPTTSTLDPSEVLKIINDYALSQGWKQDEITVMKISGYIACDDCNRTMHVHVARQEQILCMNCEGKNIHRTEAEVRLLKK